MLVILAVPAVGQPLCALCFAMRVYCGDGLQETPSQMLPSLRRRRLQARGGGVASSGRGGPTTSVDYKGYTLVSKLVMDNRPNVAVRLSDRPLPLYLGLRANRVLGGLLLHQTRTSSNTTKVCSGMKANADEGLANRFNEPFSYVCQQRRFLHQLPQVSGEWLDSWDLQQSDPLHPYGSNPRWSEQSLLFREILAGAEGDYYNVSQVICLAN